MPFNFKLPTTSALDLSQYLTSSTHPSLPLTATAARGVVRAALKKHKRLPAPSQAAHLPDILAALAGYAPYLLALDAGLSDRRVAGEHVDVVLARDVAVEWRPVLAAAPVAAASAAGRARHRTRLRSFEHELLFALATLAAAHALSARAALHSLFAAQTPAPEQRAAAVAGAMRHYLDAHAVYAFLLARADTAPPSSASSSANASAPPPPPPADVSAPVLSALASYALAEATLISVLKDDPYPAAVAQDRNAADKEWMYKAPDLPRVRAALFARLCLAAAEHAARAQGMLASAASGGGGGGGSKGQKLADALPRYVDDLRRTARGKACRFLGIDAELAGRTGEAIAWLHAAQTELGAPSSASSADGDAASNGSKATKASAGLSRLRHDWATRREDRRIERGAAWGADAGRLEEGRVVGMLRAKWDKLNSTVNVQPVPPAAPLLAALPSSREYHAPRPWVPPALDAAQLAGFRAPVERGRGLGAGAGLDGAGEDEDSFDEDEDEDGGGVGHMGARAAHEPVGAFPGTGAEYGGAAAGGQYY